MRFRFVLLLTVALHGAIARQVENPQTVAAPVVVQPVSQILQDLKSVRPENPPLVTSGTEITRGLAELGSSASESETQRVLTRDEELARLRSLPTSTVPLRQARLLEALQAIADEAGMKYIAPAEADFSERVTVNVRLNPKELLDVLAENFGFAMDYNDRGVWHFYKVNLNELVTKAYTVRFNNLVNVQITAPTINSNLSSASGSPGAQSGPSASSSGKQSNSPFRVEAERLVDTIKKLINIPTNGVATPELTDGSNTPGALASKKGSEAPEGKVIWNPDTSQIFVVGTRQQHALVEKYLKLIDQPQMRVKLAVKFVETARNPKTDFGIDWSGTAIGPNGGALAIAGDVVGTGRISTSLNLAHPSSVQLPQAILSAPAFQLTMQAFATDRMSSMLEDPTLITTNNKEVNFKATTQQPVQQSSTNIGTSTTTSTSQIVYLEIGPNISILPIVLPGDQPGKELVQLHISIVTSTIVGQTIIAGNPYPIISSRTYQYAVPVENGYTLAFAGLDERTRETNDKKVPIFGDLPVLGYAFKSRSQNQSKTTLMAFITPTIEPTFSGEPTPAASAPSAISFNSNRRTFEGASDESIEQLRQSLAGMNADISSLAKQANPANRFQVLNLLDRIGVELALMEIRLAEWRIDVQKNYSVEEKTISNYKEQLANARTSVEKLGFKAASL